MAVDVTIGSSPNWNTADYSIEEDATPLDVTSSSGGSPAFSVGTNLFRGDKSLIGQAIVIQDGAQGRIQAHINGLQSHGAGLSISGYADVYLLNTIVTAAPFSGTLAGAVGYYLGLVGFTGSNYQVDAGIASRAVFQVGFTDNLQDAIKSLCSGLQIEMSYVDGQFIFRPARTNVAQVYRNSDNEFSMSSEKQAQQISILYYNYAAKTTALAYPVTQQDRGDAIQQVSDGQTITVNIDLTDLDSDSTGPGASLSSVVQPICVSNVVEAILSFTSTQSCYSVVDSNNNAVDPVVWTSLGGSITAVVNDDSTTLTITITGMNSSLGPYRIAQSPDSGKTFYNSLRITGTGVWFNKKLWTVQTGLTARDTNTKQPPVVDNIAINTIGDAASAGLSSLRDYTGPSQSISVTTRGVNTAGKSGEYTLMQFSEWDSTFGGITFATWDASWSGKTFQQYDDYLFSLVRGRFANQAFGNVAGARVYDDYSWYRIATAHITASSVGYTAIADNTFQDWDNVWAGKRFTAWDTAWGGRRFMDYTPYLMSPGSSAPTSYFMTKSTQDFTKLSGLGYEFRPNDKSFIPR